MGDVQLALKYRYAHLDAGLYAGTASAVLEMLVHMTPLPHVPHQVCSSLPTGVSGIATASKFGISAARVLTLWLRAGAV